MYSCLSVAGGMVCARCSLPEGLWGRQHRMRGPVHWIALLKVSALAFFHPLLSLALSSCLSELAVVGLVAMVTVSGVAGQA